METDLIVSKASSALRDCSARAEQLQQHRNTAPGRQCTDTDKHEQALCHRTFAAAVISSLVKVLVRAAVYAKEGCCRSAEHSSRLCPSEKELHGCMQHGCMQHR